ncbi:alpha-ketoglutarate-dependent dioxygenase AlkB family protein [Vibrio marisflavi]|uniref:Fe2OG dioxygenase domain-containing protein n=1 Tax=Vibrio marisflavi CECT 7928 TaxID=634439 RepID=A0ABM8ZZG9_9VIBR|nr:alpha-ketoglutarate-dependent dioxygenase AlkB [Vibrio marisflavi]CAH0536313.1 hypothetical protein VMF7928_00324 [Vibrio marisflavi CECT 7928]
MDLFSPQPSEGEWITIRDGLLYWAPQSIERVYASELFEKLKREITFEQKSINIFGKQRIQPRLHAWHGDASYSYSGLTLSPHPWTETLLTLKSICEASSGQAFNSVLINLYRNGDDSMGWHSDNEPELGKDPTIASISLGETRTFHLKHIHSKEKIKMELNNGSLLVMAGSTQHYWQHSLPKTRQTKQERINLTFRYVYPTA